MEQTYQQRESGFAQQADGFNPEETFNAAINQQQFMDGARIPLETGVHESRKAEGVSSARGMGTEGEQRQNGVASKIKAQATAQELRELLDEQVYCCAACLSELDPQRTELDHKRPRSDGGDDTKSNLQWLCRHCNRAKGEMSMGAFVAMCQRITRNFMPNDCESK